MNKHDALFIRALKSRSPDFRIRRLYSKIYYPVFSEFHLTQVLSKIIRDYNLMSVDDWIDGLNPYNGWMYGIAEDATYYQRCVGVMSSFIRLSSVKSFGDFPLPAKFRNSEIK